MKIKYIPVYSNCNTVIEYINENTLRIDGTEYLFDTNSVEWPNIADQTGYVILQARRDENHELWLAVKREYYLSDTVSYIPQQDWDTGDYHDFKG